MAIDYAGLFADPNEIRNKRLQGMMQERQNISQMGGSFNQLLGQVAAGGAATGRALAEQTSGMFGLKDPAEQKAGQLQQMSQNFDTTTSEGLTAFAKALNDAGMTREAVVVLQQRDKVLASERETEKYGFYKEDRERSEQDRQRLIAQGKLRERRETVMVEKLDSKGKPTGIMEPKNVYYTEVWDEKKQRWVREEGSGAGGQVGGAEAERAALWEQMTKTNQEREAAVDTNANPNRRYVPPTGGNTPSGTAAPRMGDVTPIVPAEPVTGLPPRARVRQN